MASSKAQCDSMLAFFPIPRGKSVKCYTDCWCLDCFCHFSQIAQTLFVLKLALVTFQTISLLVSLHILLERPDSLWVLSFSFLFELQVRLLPPYNISRFTDSSLFCMTAWLIWSTAVLETQGVMHVFFCFYEEAPVLTLAHIVPYAWCM